MHRSGVNLRTCSCGATLLALMEAMAGKMMLLAVPAHMAKMAEVLVGTNAKNAISVMDTKRPAAAQPGSDPQLRSSTS